jgi:predicted MFS family arabinose efflux permease
MHAPATASADPAPSTPHDAPPGLSAWLAVLSVGIGAFALVTTEFLPVGLLPQIAAELRVTEGLAGMLVTVPGIVAAIAALAVTVGVGRADRRHVLWGLMGVMVVSNLLVTFATSFWPILVGRSLLGIGVGGFWSIGVAIGPRLVPLRYTTRATALIFGGVSVGTVAGVPAGALIGELFGWRTAFGIAAGIGVLVLAIQVFLLPPLPPTKATTVRDLPLLLRNGKARVGLAATVLMFVGQFAAYTYITPFLVQVTAMSARTVSALLLAYGAAGFVGNIVGGWVAERSARAALVGTGLVVGLATATMPLFGDSAAAATALVMIWGLGFGAMPISLQNWMFRAAPDGMETGGALFVATAQVALASGAGVGGLAVDHLGVPSAMVAGGAFALATAAVGAYLGRERGRPGLRVAS